MFDGFFSGSGLMCLDHFGFVLVCIALLHVDVISSYDRDLVDLSEPSPPDDVLIGFS